MNAFRSIKRAIVSGRRFVGRQRDRYFPALETRMYRAWIRRHVAERKRSYNVELQPGLLSILTAVWDGSPVRYLDLLAESLSSQNVQGACEWVVLDNGCSQHDVTHCLDALRRHTWVKVYRVDGNLGIIRGLRYCLERATGRYILPVDGDDLLYRDALQVVTASITKAGYPPILYTDEDKVTDRGVCQPYFKPDWDPVLLGNSAYIAHLGVVDRKEALRLGVYSDVAAEGTPDWDLFLRFASAGHAAIHIPEVLYSWRMHASSTAEDASSKAYIFSSQQAALQNFLVTKGETDRFSTENSPFFPGAAHWHFVRKRVDSKVMAQLFVGGEKPMASLPHSPAFAASVRVPPAYRAQSLASLASDFAKQDAMLCFVDQQLQVDYEDWTWEAIGLIDMFPDTMVVGGRVRNRAGQVIEAGQQLGFQGSCESPDRGRKESDPGYFGQVWKQRSVGAVSIRCAVVRAAFLSEALGSTPAEASVAFLGAWLGAHALRTRKRVVYTPFLGGISEATWDRHITAEERSLFASANKDILPDRRYYPEPFSLRSGYVLPTS